MNTLDTQKQLFIIILSYFLYGGFQATCRLLVKFYAALICPVLILSFPGFR